VRNLFWFGFLITAGVTLVVAIGKTLSSTSIPHADNGSIPLTEDRLRSLYHNTDQDFV